MVRATLVLCWETKCCTNLKTHISCGVVVFLACRDFSSQMSRLLTTEESRMNYHSRTEELGFIKRRFYIFAESNSAGLATRRMRLNDPFFRMLAMTDRTTVTEITEPLNDCQFDKNRSFQDPTHTNAYPYCTGFDRFYKGKVYTKTPPKSIK